MKRRIILLLLFCFTLVSCDGKKEDIIKGSFDIKGNIVEINDNENSILVEDKEKGLTGIVLPVNGNIKNYKEGQEVVVWVDGGIDTSSPASANALNIEITSNSDAQGKKLEEITIFKLDKETNKIVISDKNAIKSINKAIKSAIKQPGIVDMADPQYKINIGDEIYFLWLTRSDGTIGTIMNFNDTHTIYTLSENRTKELKDILFTNN